VFMRRNQNLFQEINRLCEPREVPSEARGRGEAISSYFKFSPLARQAAGGSDPAAKIIYTGRHLPAASLLDTC